jgi:hypothetical protein
MKTLFYTALAATAAALGFGGLANAHGGNVPEHGGVLQMVGDTSVELVPHPGDVQVWVEEGGEEIASAAMTGKLMITDSGASREVELQPGQGNMWNAKGLTIGHGAKVIVVMADKTSHAKTAANFTVK